MQKEKQRYKLMIINMYFSCLGAENMGFLKLKTTSSVRHAHCHSIHIVTFFLCHNFTDLFLLSHQSVQKLSHYFRCKKIKDDIENQWAEYSALVHSVFHKEIRRTSNCTFQSYKLHLFTCRLCTCITLALHALVALFLD